MLADASPIPRGAGGVARAAAGVAKGAAGVAAEATVVSAGNEAGTEVELHGLSPSPAVKVRPARDPPAPAPRTLQSNVAIALASPLPPAPPRPPAPAPNRPAPPRPVSGPDDPPPTPQMLLDWDRDLDGRHSARGPQRPGTLAEPPRRGAAATAELRAMFALPLRLAGAGVLVSVADQAAASLLFNGQRLGLGPVRLLWVAAALVLIGLGLAAFRLLGSNR
jgi:serine/threonine-protein kinase